MRIADTFSQTETAAHLIWESLKFGPEKYAIKCSALEELSENADQMRSKRE